MPLANLKLVRSKRALADLGLAPEGDATDPPG
jgi:hypothetical protein